MTEPTTSPPPEVEELTEAPLAPTPVGTTTGAATPRPGRRRRWIVALAAVAALTMATVAGAAILVGAASDSTVARWAPPDAVVYAEVRADLPGDQRAALGEFLSAFPGFADQASLERKLDELFDQLVAAATEGEQSYTGDIEPWFDGQLGVAAGPLPEIDSLDDHEAIAESARILAVATVGDPGAAMAWVRSTAAEAGVAVRTTDVGGTEVVLLGPEKDPGAAAVSGPVLLLGDEASVRDALARGGDDGLATTDGYRDAMGALPGQQAAIAYIDAAAYVAWLRTLPAAEGHEAFPAEIADAMPAWFAGGLRIESDALVGSGVMPHPSGAPDIADTRSELPGRLPAATAVLIDVHSFGKTLVEGLSRGSGAEADAMRKKLEEALRPVGGIDGLAGWMGETGLALLVEGTEPLPGVVAIPTDATAAENLARSLRNLATVAGLDPTDSTYAGATITTVDLGSLGDDVVIFDKAARQLSWTVTDDIVAVGTTPAFVKAVLDAPAADTLAEQARFRELLDRVGASHRSLVWADLDAIEALAVAQLEPSEQAHFESDIRPYLAPLDAFIGVTERDGSLDRSRALLVIDEGQ